MNNNDNKILYKKNFEPSSIIESKIYNQKSKRNNLYNIRKCFYFSIIFLLLIFITYKKKYFLYKHSILSAISIKNNKINTYFINNLKDILKYDEILENEMMKKYTTFKIGGPAKILVKPKTIKQILEIIQLCNKFKVNYFILGNGSNLLVSDKGYYGVVIQILENNFSNLEVIRIEKNNYILKVGGGMLMKTLSIEACLLSLTGLEDVIDIPGTIGGGIIMNASFRGSGLRNALEKVKIITPEGIIRELTNKECDFSYRRSLLKDKKYIIIEAIFKLKKGDKMEIQQTMTYYTKIRYERQPMYFGSAGSFFVYMPGMHKRYIESNLLSYRVGNAMVCSYNINFIVNLGNSSANEVMCVATKVEKTIKKNYGIEMKKEVILLGSFNDTYYY